MILFLTISCQQPPLIKIKIMVVPPPAPRSPPPPRTEIIPTTTAEDNAPEKKLVVALVPARAGSKGVRGKNMRPMLGKPLLQYSVEHALSCPLIDRVYVSSDSAEIHDFGVSLGATPMELRPEDKAQDDSPDLDFFLHFCEWWERTQVGENPDLEFFLHFCEGWERTQVGENPDLEFFLHFCEWWERTQQVYEKTGFEQHFWN